MRPLSRWLLPAALMLATASPAWAQGAVALERPAPTAEEREAAFGEIDAAMEAKDVAKAADLLVALTQDETKAVFHGVAYARLGMILADRGLPYASMLAIQRGLQADPTGAAFAAGKAIDQAWQVDDTGPLELVFAENVGIPVDEKTRARVAFLAAKGAAAQGKHLNAVAFLKMVGSSSPDYAEARLLEGVSLSQQGSYPQAIAALEQALAAGADRDDAREWKDLVNLNIARAYYGGGEFVRSIEYFAKVPRSSPHFMEAQFERAWAHFRLDDINGTLSLLYSHSSPYVRGEYFPEAALLEIYGLFLLCKFPQANKQIDEFQARFKPMHEALQAAGAYSEEELFQRMRTEVVDGGESGLPVPVVRGFEGEARFERAAKAVTALDGELGKLDGAQGAWASATREWLSARRSELVRTEGARVSRTLTGMEQQLDQMLQDSEMNKLDILQLESRMYERASYTGVMETAKRTVDRDLRVREGYRWWPYEGEYWADEIGWYKIRTRSECPESMRASE
ncbi:MAG: tetratricopeptide repeat protein [Alphaproteobacteria bacterium]|nr:tetratricopeptide repeat protein [Alphaproteobacteria bacterium]